MKDFLFSRD